LSGILSGKPGNRSAVPKAATSKKASKRTRATITDEIREKVIAAAKAGDKTGAQISKEFGIGG